MKLLILFGHPALHHSRVNVRLIKNLQGLENVTFHDLYETYPDLIIDIDKEQQLLEHHDCVAFMFPLYWYSTPSIFKEWQDLVLEHSWAYGSEGVALKNKLFFCIVSVGAYLVMYKEGEMQRHTFNEFLFPIEQMSFMCKMTYLPPFVVEGTHVIEKETIETFRMQLHQVLKHIADDKIDVETAKKQLYLNQYILLQED